MYKIGIGRIQAKRAFSGVKDRLTPHMVRTITSPLSGGSQVRQIFIEGDDIGIIPFPPSFSYFGSKGLGMEA